MPVSDVLKSFRKDGYGPEKDSSDKEESAGPRMIKLTDDEKKSFGEGDGSEVTCQVTGRYSDGEFSVISVQGPSEEGKGPGDENEMAAKVMGMMGGGAPMVQNQTMPSPS